MVLARAFEHRHELDAVDAELMQVGDFLDQAGVGAGGGDPRGGVPGEAAHMELVDHQVGAREAERLVILPVEVVVGDLRPVRVRIAGVAPDTPLLRATDQPGIGSRRIRPGSKR
jgi:hypothetical protein